MWHRFDSLRVWLFWIDPPMLTFEQFVQLMHELIECFRVFFVLDSKADPIHSFSFFGSHLPVTPIEKDPMSVGPEIDAQKIVEPNRILHRRRKNESILVAVWASL
jgi:hypothetical protein